MSETSSASAPRTRRPVLRGLLLLFGLLTAVGIVLLLITLTAWTRWERVTPEQARAAIDATLAEIGGGPAYAEIVGDEQIILHHEQEPAAPEPLGRIRVLVWTAEKGKLVRLSLPSWFVKLKASATFGLDAFIDEISEHVSGRVQISLHDLQARGPGLYLDYTFDEGRILVWGEGR